MGRTLQTTNQLILEEQDAFKQFRRALRKTDQQHFDALFAGARNHTAAIGQANHALPFEAVLMAMLIEQSRRIARLEAIIAVGMAAPITAETDCPPGSDTK